MYLTHAELKDNHVAILTFSTGEVRSVDFTLILKNLKNDAAKIVESEYFMKGEAKDGFLQWPNGYAIDPDGLYNASKPYKHTAASSFLARIHEKQSRS